MWVKGSDSSFVGDIPNQSLNRKKKIYISIHIIKIKKNVEYYPDETSNW